MVPTFDPVVGSMSTIGSALSVSCVYMTDWFCRPSVYYVTRSPADDKGARVLLDPNGWSKDGTIAMSGTTYTHDGELLAYGVSSGGSDQKDIRVLRVADGQRLPDELKRMKFANVAWKHDKSGFWYNRYPTPGSVPRV